MPRKKKRLARFRRFLPSTRRDYILALVGLSVAIGLSWLWLRPSQDVHAWTSPPIQVELLRQSGALSFAVSGAFRIESESGTLLHVSPEAKTLSAKVDDNLIDLGFQAWPSPIRIVPAGGANIECHDLTLPGNLILKGEKTRIKAINELDIETYVVGVLFAEMPAYFSREALKAQSIAIRSYAWHQYHHKKRPLFADQRSQVYRGQGKLDAKAKEIVQATFGTVLTFEDEVIPAFFHSTCGGQTAASGLAFGGETLPPFRGGPCNACQDSPRYRWTARLSLESLERDVLSLGPNESLRSIRLETRPDGHAGRLGFETTQRTLSLKASSFRSRTRSHLSSGAFYSTNVIGASVEGNQVVITGSGFGHGVGFCQYGAHGWGSNGKSFQEILELYYPGATLKGLW